MLKVLRHLRANAIAYAALFVALGGTSYAAGTLAKNSVGSKQIQKGAVHASDIASNAVTSAKVKNGALRAADFRATDLASLKGPKGDTGAKGDKGDPGIQGPPGPTSGGAKYATSKFMTSCSTNTLVTKELTVSTPSRIFASGQYVFSNNGTATNGGVLTLQLLDAGAGVVASGQTVITYGNQEPLVSAGILMAGSNPTASDATPYVANAGTYTLRMTGDISSGSCGVNPVAVSPGVSYVLLGNG